MSCVTCLTVYLMDTVWTVTPVLVDTILTGSAILTWLRLALIDICNHRKY